jgi:fumarate reductase subunit D
MAAQHEPWHRRQDLKPAYGHGFWWFMFGNGGAIAAILLPVTILVVGVLGPLGVPNWTEDAKHFAWTLSNPLVKLFLLVLVFFTLIHAAHRLRYTLYDLGVRGSVKALEWICYGAAIAGTVIAAVLLFTTP